jgi:hypothetical protein
LALKVNISLHHLGEEKKKYKVWGILSFSSDSTFLCNGKNNEYYTNTNDELTKGSQLQNLNFEPFSFSM